MKFDLDDESTARSAKRASKMGKTPSDGTLMTMAGNNAKAEKAENTAKEARTIVKRYAIVGSVAVVVLAVGFLGLNIAGSEISKDAKPSASAELRTTDGKDDLVVTGEAESYGLLTDLPTMPLEFLNAMDKLTYNVRGEGEPECAFVAARGLTRARARSQDNGAVKIAQIMGMEWVSTSHMLLDLAPVGLEGTRRHIEARE